MLVRDAIRVPAAFVPISLLTALMLVAPSAANRAQAVLIASESFDYRAGMLRGSNGGTGWKQAWFEDGEVPGSRVSEIGLTYPGLKVLARANQQEGNDVRTFRYLDIDRPEVAALVNAGPTGKGFGKDGTTIWIAFVVSLNSYPKTGHGGIHLMEGVEGGFYKDHQRIQMGRRNQDSHWMLARVTRGAPGEGKWETAVTADSTVRLLVYRFDFKPGSEEGWMWVDPKPGASPDPAQANLHAADITDFRFNAVNLGSGGGATFLLDELRIGTTFADVVPAGGRN